MARRQKCILDRILAMFICFEGMAGTGKTSQANYLKALLSQQLDKIVTISAAFEGKRKQSTEKFISSFSDGLPDMAIMFLFQTLHVKQYNEVKEALNNGHIVIADRWRASFYAYHSYYGPLADLDPTILTMLDNLAFETLNPGLTILLDTPEKVAYHRYIKRGVVNSVIRQENLDFFYTMRSHYLSQALMHGWYVINADRSKKEIAADIKGIVLERLSRFSIIKNRYK
jgi:dTMP kinase